MSSNQDPSFWNFAENSVSALFFKTTLLAGAVPLIFLLALVIFQRDTSLPKPSGCYKLGRRGRSNLEDQYSKRWAKGGEATPANPWTIKALFVYPIKSCAPIELEKTDIIRTGLKYDRQFTLAQHVTGLPALDGKVNSEWQFMTQRKFPRLAKVETEVWVPDPSAPDYKEDSEWVKSGGCVVVRFPFSPDTDFTFEGIKNWAKILAAKVAKKPEPTVEFVVPFNPTKDRIKSKGYTNETVTIWKDKPVALNVSSEVDPEILAKLRYTLGSSNPIALFRIDTNQYREVYKNAPKAADVGFQTIVGMQDSYPVHIINLASLHDVASKLPRMPFPNHFKVPILNGLRFRANIYITGPPAFHEDDWKKARITSGTTDSSTEFDISCRTTRCNLPNVDPETGIADRNEPNTTLRSYRVIDGGSKSACLGMQVTPLSEGHVAVGDRVEVLETGEHFFKKE